MIKKWVKRLVVITIIGVIAIQFVPYGRSFVNPKVVKEPQWDSPRTQELAKRACYDCHSNETKWPWYSAVAPMSWFIKDHVDEGRREMNFSEADRPQRHFQLAAELTAGGEMPLESYLWLHSEAKLSDGEKSELVRGFKATFGERQR